MSIMGDYFPDHLKDEHIKKNLVPGQILYLFCTFTDPDKDKYLILVHSGNPLYFFVINSRIRSFVQNRQWLLDCQVRIEVADYDFLDRDSHADCSSPISLSKDYVRDQLEADISRIKGKLHPSKVKEIIKVVNQSTTISSRDKTLISKSLKSSI